MKNILFCLGLVAALVASAEKVPLFITGGQSNTDGRLNGRSEGEELPGYLAQGNPKALVWMGDGKGGGSFVPFAPATKQRGQSPRWAYDAVTYYHLSQAMGTIYVAKFAYGGTSIDPKASCSPSKHPNKFLPQYGSGYHWSAEPSFLAATKKIGETFELEGVTYDGQSLLLKWIERIDETIDALAKEGKEPDIKAILWHQGESDRKSAEGYEANLLAVIAYVRAHLVEKTGKAEYAKLPFFCGTIPVKSRGHSSKVDKIQRALDADKANNIHVIDISDITLKKDQMHFSAQGAEIFGRRLYNRLVDEGVVKGMKVD